MNELTALHRRFLIPAVCLTLMGVFCSFDAGYARALGVGRALPPEFINQVIFAFLALVGFFIVSKVAPSKIERWARPVWWFSLFTLLITAFSPLRVTRSGATRWFHVGKLEVQPAEFAKLAAVLFLAAALSSLAAKKGGPRTKKWNEIYKFKDLWFGRIGPFLVKAAPFLVVLFALGLIEREPDLGTAAVIAAVALGMFFAAGVKSKSLVLLIALGAIAGVAFVISQPYRLGRFQTHGSQWSARNVDGPGFQQLQSKTMMAITGWGIRGPGVGRLKYVIPAPTTDFVTATIGEEFGFFGVALVLGLLGWLVFEILYLASKERKGFSALVLAGIALWLAIQGVVNVLQANDTIPAIGIPYPFVSSGGSSLLALWLAMAVTFVYAKRTATSSTEEEEVIEDHRHRRRDGRSHLSRA